MKENYTYIDLDGVTLDSQQRLLERKEKLNLYDHESLQEFVKYFKYTDEHPEEWDYIIRESNSLNYSVEIIRELQNLKKNIAILTKVNTMYEMQVKVDDLRNHRKIEVPIIFVPSILKKSQVINPNRGLLIDDSKRNIKEWTLDGGEGLLFDPNLETNTSEKVKSLEFLLKR